MRKYDFKKLREILLNKDDTWKLAESSIDEVLETSDLKGLEKKMAEMWVKTNIKRSIGEIFNSSESPIEKIFFCSLVMFGLMEGLTFLTITPKGTNVENFIASSQLMSNQILNLKKEFADANPEIVPENIGNELFSFIMNNETIDDDFKEYIQFHHLIYDTLGLSNAFHITPQAYIPNLKIDGKAVRVDVMIWVPNNSEFKWIIECDGFNFHSDKKAFTNDRRRDRKLQNLGYKVLRFSGTEIYHNPVESSGELFNYLIDCRKEA